MLWMEIGDIAGKVYELLKEKEPMTVPQMEKELQVPYNLLQMSIGWLAREDKVKFEKVGRSLKVSLK